MNPDSCIPLKDHRERQNPFLEVTNAEKQLWAFIHSKGLLQTEVQDLYLKVRSGYEKIILNNDEGVELQDIEFSLWKLHYKHVDEFRKRVRQTSANSESTNSSTLLNVANLQSSIDCHMERFKVFLSEATEFYQDLITKLRRRYELPEDPLFYENHDISCVVDPAKLRKCQFSCHRFLVCLGDLARYRELCKKLDFPRHDWSVAATYYFKATLVWPDSGNPQNQLAVLATYVGDDYMALYHCIRSLAIKEPFPDAWNNLIFLFEKNRSSHLHSLSKEAHFNFLNPSERSTSPNESQSRFHSFNNDTLQGTKHSFSANSDLWTLFVRMISFFFIESSLDEFPCTFASTMREMDSLLALDDTELKSTLECYQHMDSSRTGPYRALQMVSVLIFIIDSLTERSEHMEAMEKNNPMLIQSALTATYICMARLVERCMTGNKPLELTPLLPPVLVFVEWLVGVLDKVETYHACEKVRAAVSYFFDAFVVLLNQLDKNESRFKYEDHTALWEDHELRGFALVAHAHELLDFAGHSTNMGNFESRNVCRAHRIYFMLQQKLWTDQMVLQSGSSLIIWGENSAE
ncbi:protein SMG7L-like [Camellia sinensis]|uniref:protein SMG7L-like n=1 Tax=Camellia sinensis TaxID=4442 RepID=UPI001035A054|nr:protein SMG7L-like [Camellia sinensis]XP_028071407.1 protein SMG7L-like [Camellia sinensis]